MPQAEALAIRGGDILAVGSNEVILALSGSETKVIDLGSRALLPGFVDTHAHLFLRAMPNLGLTHEEAQKLVLSGGITTIAELYVPPHIHDEMRDFEAQGKLRIRTSLYLLYIDPCGTFQGDWYLDHPPVLDPTQMLRIPGIKIYSDGGSCGQAAFSYDLPNPRDPNYPQGNLFLTEEELTEDVAQVQAAGYQAVIHALGDRAVETVQDALEAVLEGGPNTYRHRIDHNRFIRADLMPRYGEIGIIPSVVGGPRTCLFVDQGGVSRFGEAAHPMYVPYRALLDANPGLPVAWYTDLPTRRDGVLVRPIPDLHWLVTRKQLRDDGVTVCEPMDWLAAWAITVEEALRMMTINAAYALFMEEKVGSLKPDKFADLIILSENPLTVEPDSLINLEVLMTMVGGRVEHCAEGHETLCP